MDNKKLFKMPAAMIAMLLVTVLTLGLYTTGCNDSKNEDDQVDKVTITVPVNVDNLESLENSTAPENVQKFQVCGFDKDGEPTNKTKSFTRTTGKNPEVLTLSKNNVGVTSDGLTYGTKTILVTYLDSSDSDNMLGYSLFTNVNLYENTNFTVSKVILHDDIKVNGNLSMWLDTNLEEVEEGPTESSEGAVEHCYHRGYCDNILKVYAMLHDKDTNTDMNITDNGLVTWADTTDTPDLTGDTSVLTSYTGSSSVTSPGQYTMKNPGTSVVSASLDSLSSLVYALAEISVISKNIEGTVPCSINDADWPTVSSAAKATIGSSSKLDVDATEHTITMNNALTYRVVQTVTFYDAAGNKIAEGKVPSYVLTQDGEIVDPALEIYDVTAI